MKKLIIILIIFIGSSCSDSKKIYDVTGVVLDINLDNKKILVDHDSIPNFMMPMVMHFNIENKNVVIIDDVLFSGRSVRAALTAIQAYGRPKNIELLVLIDRRFSRHLPIQPNYRGRQVDAINEERVVVNWRDLHDKDAVYIENK